MSDLALPVDEVERGSEAERGGVRDTLGGADDEVTARRQRVSKTRVEGVADLFGEVDDGVSAHDQVVAGGPNGHPQQVADVEARHAHQLRLRLPSTFIGR